jgi:glutathione S-transferase
MLTMLTMLTSFRSPPIHADSERVWLTLELKNIDYDTIRIDNTGGPRPSYFAGTTPQMKWPDGRMQGESLDLVRDLDAAYADSLPLLFQDSKEVEYFISQFQSIFPRSRPSSRAAFLFQYNGEPLWRGVFEETLQKTDELLSKNSEGPFFCGSTISGADVAWAPFLERYRYQLPCLHNGLEPNDANKYSNLAAWYSAMDQVPAYACRVKGDASSWRKVLSMAGFGNAFVPPEIKANMEFLAEKESMAATSTIDNKLWAEYTSFRPYLADTPHAEAALVMTRNRKAISIDAVKRANDTMWKERGLPTSEGELEKAMMELVQSLIHDDDALLTDRAAALAGYLDERMCVPRDMGAMPAATMKLLARVKA